MRTRKGARGGQPFCRRYRPHPHDSRCRGPERLEQRILLSSSWPFADPAVLDSPTDVVMTGEQDSSQQLGVVDFLMLPAQNPAAGDLWYQLQPMHDAILTLEALAADAQIALLDTPENELAVSQPSGTGHRLDWLAPAGQSFYVRLGGAAQSVDLRITNLVQHDAAAVTVYGTSHDDGFTFDASAASHQLTIKEVAYEFTAAEAVSFFFDGLAGNDDVYLVGSGGVDDAVLGPARAVMSGEGYTVRAVNIESGLLDGGNGEDAARLHGTRGANALTAGGEAAAADPTHVTLLGGRVSLDATVETIYVHGRGGKDTATLHTSGDNNILESSWKRARMGGEGYQRTVRGFAITVQEPPLEAPSNLASVAASPTRIDVSWQDHSSLEQQFTIERRTDAGAWDVIGSVPADVTTYADESVQDGAAYFYRVQAHSGTGGTSDYSNEASATTPLALPSDLMIVDVSSRQVDLQWQDHSASEQQFTIERRKGTGAWAPIGSVAANLTTYSDTSVSDGTAYSYRVYASNLAAGNSAYSNEAGATTPLAAPSALVAAAVSSSQIDLEWQDHSDTEAGFLIEREYLAGVWLRVGSAGEDATTYQVADLQANTTYSYRVVAYQGSPVSPSRVSPPSNAASATTQPPAGSPEITVKGNGRTLNSGDTTPRVDDNTDFDVIRYGESKHRQFLVINDGDGILTLAPVTVAPIPYPANVPPVSPFTVTEQVPGALQVRPADPFEDPFTISFSADPWLLPGRQTARVSINHNDIDGNETPYWFYVEAMVSPSGADTVGPQASFVTREAVMPGDTEFRITVRYTDDLAIDMSSLGDGDIRVDPPSSISSPIAARLDPASVRFLEGGRSVEATYFITPPGGVWDATDSSSYDYMIQMVAGEVRDTRKRTVDAQTLSTFKVNISSLQTTPQVLLAGSLSTVSRADLLTRKSSQSAGLEDLDALAKGLVGRSARRDSPAAEVDAVLAYYAEG